MSEQWIKDYHHMGSNDVPRDYNIPDRSRGDLYCPLCESHMNSDQMWQAHIIGKKHIKNMKKGEVIEQKYEDIPHPATIQQDFNCIEEPVVGLKYLSEVWKRGASAPIYMCYLCNANLALPKAMIDHVLDSKHKLAFIKENDVKSYNSIDLQNFSKSALESIVNDLAARLEMDLGRGEVSAVKELERKEEWRPSFQRPVRDHPPHITASKEIQDQSHIISSNKQSKVPPTASHSQPKRESPKRKENLSTVSSKRNRSPPSKRSSDTKSRKSPERTHRWNQDRKPNKGRQSKEKFRKRRRSSSSSSSSTSDEDYRKKPRPKNEAKRSSSMQSKSSNRISDTSHRNNEMQNVSNNDFNRTRTFEPRTSTSAASFVRDLRPSEEIFKDLLPCLPPRTVLAALLDYLNHFDVPALKIIKSKAEELILKKNLITSEIINVLGNRNVQEEIHCLLSQQSEQNYQQSHQARVDLHNLQYGNQSQPNMSYGNQMSLPNMNFSPVMHVTDCRVPNPSAPKPPAPLEKFLELQVKKRNMSTIDYNHV